MKISKSGWVAGVLVGFAFTSVLRGQHQTRSLSGTVTDRKHEPLRGAVVQAQNVYTETVVSYVTGQNGQYRFKRIDGDCDYKISASWHNLHSATKNLSLFDSNSAKIINLTIKPH